MEDSSNKGFDKVTMSVIKDALPCILPVLTDIVNRSLLSSVFPAVWKISEVIPLLKDGDHEIPNNNQPVSLLPAASKICERVALNQLMTYMTTKKRLSEHQSGNKKLHSCETLNVMITDKASIYLNNIPSILDVCSLESYVDDSKLCLSFPVAEASNMIQQINKDLEKIASWCCCNSLLKNPEKTSCWCWAHVRCFRGCPLIFMSLSLERSHSISFCSGPWPAGGQHSKL